MIGTQISRAGCRYLATAYVALTMVLVGGLSFAQLPTATILGTVRDSSGAIIPGVNVTAKDVDTGQVRSTVSAADGSYRFSALPIGNYEVRSEHPGFQSEVRSGLTLTVGQEAVVNFTLELGAVEQSVSVTAEAPLVNTTSGTLGSLVGEQKVADLPLNGRNFMELALNQPGVVHNFNVSSSSFSGVGMWYSSNGAPLRSNNYLLDGAIMTNASGGTSSAQDGTTLGVEGIREYRVITNSFSAEYGISSGSQVMIVSKSGTNQLHGSAFEYLRNSALDARNFFDYSTPARESRLPAFRRNQFGGSLGGPLKKDKTFVFGVYEGLRQRTGITTVDNVIPVSAKVNGGAGGVPQIAPVVQPLLALFPNPNLPGNEFTYPFSDPDSDNYGQVRVDQTFSSTDSLFARYTTETNQETDPVSYPQFVNDRSSRSQFATLSESRVISPTLLNTAHVSFSRTTPTLTIPLVLIGPDYSFVEGKQLGSISVGGVTTIGPSALPPDQFRQNIFTYSDDLFYARGRNSLKFGALVNHYQQYLLSTTNSRGSVSFANLNSFLLGQPTTYTSLTPGSILDREYHYNTFGFYGQDDFRVLTNLTLNLGLRYEFQTVPQDVNGINSALRDVQHDASATLGPVFKNPSLLNFSPRFGFAWDVTGNGKTAIRGGFAELYDIGLFGQALSIAITGTPPFATSSTVTNPGTLTLPLFFPPSAVGKSLRTQDYQMQQPHLLSYNVTVERQLPAKMVLTLAYAGSRGINLLETTEGNPTVPQGMGVNGVCGPAPASVVADIGRSNVCWLGNDPRTNPNWSSIDFRTAGGSSSYNALQFSLVKQLSHGLELQSSYTWSKIMDYTQGQASGDNSSSSTYGTDPADNALARSVADFDATQVERLNAIYALPRLFAGHGMGAVLDGWKTSGLLSLSSGLPFTPALNTNRSQSGLLSSAGGIDRPDLLPGRNGSNIVSGSSVGCQGGPAAGTPVGTPNRYFDPCAFILQPTGFLGNAGRNILRGPGLANLDFSLIKDTAVKALGESGALEFRAEFFNILNRPNFAQPNRIVFSGTGPAGPAVPLSTAGQITATNTTSRQIQFALRLHF
jgi:hypothetical protein